MVCERSFKRPSTTKDVTTAFNLLPLHLRNSPHSGSSCGMGISIYTSVEFRISRPNVKLSGRRFA